MFCASEFELHDALRCYVKELFDYDMAPPRPEKGTLVSYVPAVVREALSMLGIPRGKKARTNPRLPEMLLKSENLVALKALVAGLLETDGCANNNRANFYQSVEVKERGYVRGS